MQRSKGEERAAGMNNGRNPYRGVRRRKWGRWVSEIRLPGSRDRLWLGSYSSPEGAAAAHDTAVFCLRGPSAVGCLNFPGNVSPYLRLDMSPKSVKRAAVEAGMAADKGFMSKLQEGRNRRPVHEGHMTAAQAWAEDRLFSIWGQVQNQQPCEEELSITVDDMEILF